MPNLPCPACGRITPRHLHHTSAYALVNSYVCEGCGHIWTIDKLDRARVTHVTPLPKTTDGSEPPTND